PRQPKSRTEPAGGPPAALSSPGALPRIWPLKERAAIVPPAWNPPPVVSPIAWIEAFPRLTSPPGDPGPPASTVTCPPLPPLLPVEALAWIARPEVETLPDFDWT